MKLRKGDTVLIVKGSNRGKTGVISLVLPDSDAVIVDGVNVRTTHRKPRLRNTKGQLEKKAMPIAVSNVSFFDRKSKKRTRIGYTGVGKKKQRVSRVSGAVIPAPKEDTAKKKTVSAEKKTDTKRGKKAAATPKKRAKKPAAKKKT